MHNISVFDRNNNRYQRFFNDDEFKMKLDGSAVFDSPFIEHFGSEPWPNLRNHQGRGSNLDSRKPVHRFADPIETHRIMMQNFQRRVDAGFNGFRRLNDFEESSSASTNSRQHGDPNSRVRIIPIQVIRESKREVCEVQRSPAPKFIDVDYVSDDSDYEDVVVIGRNNNNNGVRRLHENIQPAKKPSNSRQTRSSQGRNAHQGRVDSHVERARPTEKQSFPPVLEINDSLTECFRPSVSSYLGRSNQNTSSNTVSTRDGAQASSVQAADTASVPDHHIQSTPGYPLYAYIKSRLQSDGRLVDYIQGDGNCFFRALSKEIYGQEMFHSEVRQAVVDVIEKYSKEFEQFLDDGSSLREHIKEMRLPSTWSSTMEIYAAATLLQRDMYVLSPDHTGDSYDWLLFSPRFTYNGHMSYHPCYLTLCHTNGNHYDRIAASNHACNCKTSPPKLKGTESYVDLTNVDLSVC